MDKTAEIAAGLTSGQARLLLGTIGPPLSPASYAQIRSHLMRKGLWATVGLTPLGKAVRAILQEQSNAGL